ncbi:MAG TPA: DUF192 domain-containing protein [Actinomycetota bacterium]|nr:DUF192 domain-containing protein [Actinomycetota bacterium]
MRKAAVALVLCCLVVAACGDDGETDGAAAPSPVTSFPFATALLDNGDESTLVTVEVAETPEQHEAGLSRHTSLEEDWGMAFVFFEQRDAALPMNETTIPLSIAYFDAEGTILEIGDSEPREIHEPAVAYMAALAVNQGSFDEWDISEGDTIHLTR